MNQQELNTLRDLIESEIESCKTSIEQITPSAKPISPDNAIGRLSRADGMNDQGISSAALSNTREKLYKLEQARDNLNQPGFGDCTICGNPIAVERLAALPESTRCTRCASR